jgi:hypothetical protein
MFEISVSQAREIATACFDEIIKGAKELDVSEQTQQPQNNKNQKLRRNLKNELF